MLSPNEPDSGSSAAREQNFGPPLASDFDSATLDKAATETSVLLKADGRLHRVELAEIRFIESKGDYLCVNTDRRSYFVHATMKSMQESLPANDFIRIHRSYTVRIDRIDKVRSTCLHVGELPLPVGVTYRTEVSSSLAAVSPNTSREA